MDAPATRSRQLVSLAVAVLLAGCSPAPPGSSAPSGSPSVGASPQGGTAVVCPPYDAPDVLDGSYLAAALPERKDGSLAQVIVIEEAGRAELTGAPLVISTELVGPTPVVDAEQRVVAIEATDTGGCALRLLLDVALLEPPTKGGVVALELTTREGSFRDDEAAGLCTWLAENRPSAGALECVGMPATDTASRDPWRLWIRLSFAEPVDATGSLPGWALDALGIVPGTEASDDTAFRLEPLANEPWQVVDGPFGSGSMLEASAVAPGPTGWVAAGSYQPWSEGDDLSTADVPIWWSPDGRTWERVDGDQPALGGPGFQFIDRLAATAEAWWAIGTSAEGPADQPVFRRILVRSRDGATWDTVVPVCVTTTDCDATAFEHMTALGTAGGTAVLAGLNGRQPTIWRLDGDGRIVGSTEVPVHGDAGIDMLMRPVAIADGAAGTVLVAQGYRSLTEPGVGAWAWVSPDDGVTWTALMGDGNGPLVLMEWVADAVMFGDGFLVVGSAGIVRCVADVCELVDASSAFRALAAHGELAVVVGGESEPAGWSRDGSRWNRLPISPGPRDITQSILDVASDGTTLVAVGTLREHAGAWIGAGSAP